MAAWTATAMAGLVGDVQFQRQRPVAMAVDEHVRTDNRAVLRQLGADAA
ncbi:hypothetical protein [Promicromonospora sp. NPDC019610]